MYLLDVVELDRRFQRRRQAAGEGVAGLEQPGLELGIDQPQAMARLDIGEGERGQAVAVLRRQRGDGSLAQPAQQRPVFRQILGGDEAELLEEGMARRQIGEQLDHGLGDAPADIGQGLGEAGIGQHLEQIGIARDAVGLQLRPDRGPEQQVLHQRHVLVVAVDVEGLDQGGERRIGEAVAQVDPGLDEFGGEVALGEGVDRPAQAELIDVILEFDQRQGLDDPARRGCSCRSPRPPRSRSSRR